jgi:hypothetical protein
MLSVSVGACFGRWTVLDQAEPVRSGGSLRAAHVCRCSCGTVRVVRDDMLRNGESKSCGCLQRETAARTASAQFRTHGKTRTRMYRIWRAMKRRCLNQSATAWDYYGGRGITVCAEWRVSFEAFRDWAFAHGYRDDLSIDRIDVNGNYEPSNCRWATWSEQMKNRRARV